MFSNKQKAIKLFQTERQSIPNFRTGNYSDSNRTASCTNSVISEVC